MSPQLSIDYVIEYWMKVIMYTQLELGSSLWFYWSGDSQSGVRESSKWEPLKPVGCHFKDCHNSQASKGPFRNTLEESWGSLDPSFSWLYSTIHLIGLIFIKRNHFQTGNNLWKERERKINIIFKKVEIYLPSIPYLCIIIIAIIVV